MTTYVTLETARLHLKPLSSEDIPNYQKHFNNYAITRYLTANVPWPFPENGAESFYQSQLLPVLGKSRWVWGLHLKDNPCGLIGAIDLWLEGKPENRGFWLAEPYWGNGYMTEATDAVTDYAFDKLDFKKLTFSNAVGNTRSARVKEKASATYLRTEPMKFVDPQFTEHELWELTAENWRKHRK